MRILCLVLFLTLILNACLERKVQSNQSTNVLLYSLLNQNGVSSASDYKGINVKATVLEKDLLRGLTANPVQVESNGTNAFYKKNANDKYVSQQWTLRKVEKGDKLLVQFESNALSPVVWEFYLGITPLGTSSRKNYFLQNANNIDFIDKTSKAFLIKFKEPISGGISFFSYMEGTPALYNIRKCQEATVLCAE